MAKPTKIADVLGELFSRRGFARVQAASAYAEAWAQAVGETLGGQTRLVAVRRGVVEIVVANSTLAQELSFQKRDILRKLALLLPDEQISGMKCRVGPAS